VMFKKGSNIDNQDFFGDGTDANSNLSPKKSNNSPTEKRKQFLDALISQKCLPYDEICVTMEI
jgi:hypothetical protein